MITWWELAKEFNKMQEDRKRELEKLRAENDNLNYTVAAQADMIARLKRGDFTDEELAVLAANHEFMKELNWHQFGLTMESLREKSESVEVPPPCPVCGPVCRGEH